MSLITRDDLIQSIQDSLQYISYYHPADFIRAMGEAYAREESAAARDAMAQILVNSRMCAEGHRPICQDTGIVNVFVSVGMDVRFETDMSFEDMINEGVRRAYALPDNVLRASLTRRVSVSIRRTIRRQSFIPSWLLVKQSRSGLLPRVAVLRPNQSL